MRRSRRVAPRGVPSVAQLANSDANFVRKWNRAKAATLVRVVLRRSVTVLSLGVIACTADRPGRADESSVGLTAATASVSLTSGSTGDAATTAGDADAGKLDLEAMVPQMGCTKVDLVFVVDNSASMFDEQQQLIASVPGFIASIESLLGEDFHVMVIDTDIGTGGGCYEAIFNSFDCGLWCPANCPDGCHCECNAQPCAAWGELPCDALMGAGRIADVAGTVCGLPGRRWLDAADPDRDATFQCMASVGIEGEPTERPVQALSVALGELAAADACNQGFLRQDALLVVTLISDEDDSLASPGEPAQWHDAMVAIKDGNPNAVVMLGLLGDSDLPDGLCAPFDPTDNSGSQPSTRLREWVELFHYGERASVCEAEYAGIFDAALASIVTACDEFVPPG